MLAPVGDFNEIASVDEKKGGAPVDIRQCNIFAQWINTCGLLNLGSVGTGSRGGDLKEIVWKEFLKD